MEIADFVGQVTTVQQFSEIAQDLSFPMAGILLAFASRTASYAVRIQDAIWIHRGLMAAQLALAQVDPREVLMIFSVLYRGLELLDENPDSVFEEMATLAVPEIGDFTMRFAQRDEADRSIAAMGYVEGADEDGFDFIRTW